MLVNLSTKRQFWKPLFYWTQIDQPLCKRLKNGKTFPKNCQQKDHLKCITSHICHYIHSLLLRSGSVHWRCEVVVSWWGLCLLGVPQWHCRCCCPHRRGLCSWCESCLPCSLTGRMSACDLCNVHVDSFDLIFSDVYIGCYSDIVCSTDCAIFSLCTVIPFSPTGF